MKGKNRIFGIAVITAITFGLLSCTNSDQKEVNSNVKKIKVAFDQASKPLSYVDEKGEPNGYDVEIMKAIDKELKDYEFEYVPTSNDDLLVGVQQGKYDVGVKNAFFTKEREGKYIFPKEFLGLSSIGVVLKEEDKDVDTLEKFAKKNYKLAPIAANNAQYTIIDEYNKANPNNKVNLVAGDTFSVDIVQWITEGRSDGGVTIEGSFLKSVVAEEGQYHNFKDSLVYKEIDVIKTWPLFNLNNQKLADDYDVAVKKVKEDKIPNELSKKFYGRDLFEVLDQVKR